MKNISVAKKLALGFGVLVAIMGIVGYIGLLQMGSIHTAMDDFSRWSDYDMVMNEDVIQKVMGLENQLELYIASPGQKTLDDLISAHGAAAKGLQEWSSLVAAEPRLHEKAKKYLDVVNGVKGGVDDLAGSFLSVAGISSQQDSLVNQLLSQMNTAMDQIIDPAKNAAIKAGDSSSTIQWGRIDEIMNEAVIASTLRLQTAVHDYVSSTDESAWKALQEVQAGVDAGLSELNTALTGREDLKADLGKISELLKTFSVLNGNLHEAFQRIDDNKTAILEKTHSLRNDMEQLMAQDINSAKAVRVEAAEKAYTGGRLMILIGIVLAFAVGVALAVLITRGITAPLRSVVDALNAIAGGDLTVTPEVVQKDEIGQLADTQRNMIDKLKDVVIQVQAASENVASGSEEMSSSSEELSQGSTEQASNLEEITSSMEEMGSNINQNADNAAETEKIARQAARDAEDGGRQVQDTVRAMKNIAEKISIIEEIARQTNLLALNAAIEAARAGDAGRGFAVVAAEVRKLAERSGLAAKEIGELSVSSVDIAEKAGRMLEKMVPDIRKTAELVQEISAASREQTAGAAQINQAIAQLDQVVQQNASSAEEVSSTAQELASQAQQMQSTMSFFNVNGNGAKKPGVGRQTLALHRAHAGGGNGDGIREKLSAPVHPPALPARAPGNGNGRARVLLAGNAGDPADHDFERF